MCVKLYRMQMVVTRTVLFLSQLISIIMYTMYCICMLAHLCRADSSCEVFCKKIQFVG